MLDTDMIIVSASYGSVVLEDYYSKSHFIPPKDSDLGGVNDLIYLDGGLDANSHIDIWFYRKLNTGDKFDKVIVPDDETDICWAYKDYSSGIQRHSDSDTGSASIKFATSDSKKYFKRYGLDQVTKDHSTLMSVSWGVSIVIAVIAARYFKWTSWWIYIHVILGSQVIISTIVSSTTQYNYDQIFHITMHDLQLFSSRFGFFIVSLCAGQGVFGLLLLYVRSYTQNYQAITFLTKSHKAIGWILVICGFVSIHLGKDFLGSELVLYYFMMALLGCFEVFALIQALYPKSRFFVRKLKKMTHQEAFFQIINGRPLVFADNLVVDIGHFQYSHPGGKFMVAEAIGEDIGKYLTGCSSYGGSFQPYEHSEYTFTLIKQLAIGEVPYPKGYLTMKSGSLNQNSMEFFIFSQQRLSDTIWLLTLKSENFYMADTPEPEWLGKHFKVSFNNSRTSSTRRYYSSLFADLGHWAEDLGLTLPGHKECPGSVKLVYKAYTGGKMTQYLFSLPSKSPLTIQGPLGPGLMLDSLQGNYLAFAGGTGLVPFLDLLYLIWLKRHNIENFSFILYLFFRSYEESFCLDLVKKMQEVLPEFFFLRLIITSNRKSFIVEKEIGTLTAQKFDKVWLCGPSGLNRRVYDGLVSHGVDRNTIILM